MLLQKNNYKFFICISLERYVVISKYFNINLLLKKKTIYIYNAETNWIAL